MTAVAFDTLRFARSLRERAKLSPEQAEGLADAMVEVLDGNLATKIDVRDLRSDIEALRLHTKADIETLRHDIEALKHQTKADIEALRHQTKADTEALKHQTKADVEALRHQTKADIEATKSDTIKWMFGTIGFQTIVILGAVVALARSLH